MENEEKSAKRLRIAKLANSTKDIPNDNEDQIVVASSFFVNEESSLTNKIINFINNNPVPLICDQLDDSICLTTYLELQIKTFLIVDIMESCKMCV